MAKLILYSPFYKASENNLGGYARYLATREGVEFPKNTKLKSPATKKQKELIEKMLKDFPNSNELLEYKDYIFKPTIENASEFITRVLESNVQSESIGSYAKYMATRPGAEKIAEHGLFSDNGKPIVLSKVEKELNEYNGNVWTHIISLKREDAARLGFDHVKAWQDLLSAKRNEIAKEMNIDPKNFIWYAAFHNEGHHPHVHMLAYSSKPTEPYLSKKGIRNIKSCLAKEIFKNDLLQIYDKQTEYRNELKKYSKELTEQLISKLKHGDFHNENMEQLLFQLNKMLSSAKGKKVYGYLKPEVKATVNQIVDELEKDSRVKLLLKSDVIPKDTERAIKLLISAIEKNNEWAKILLGKMLLFGIDIQKDEERGIELLQSAAEQGNEYAANILQNRENYLKYMAAMSAMRLFGYIGTLFSRKFNTDKSKTGFRIDKKQYRQIQEKKMAQGLRS